MTFFKLEDNLFPSRRKTEFLSVKSHTVSVRAFNSINPEESALIVFFMTKNSHPNSFNLLTSNINDFIRLQQLLMTHSIPADSLIRSSAEHVFAETEPDFSFTIKLNKRYLQPVKDIFKREYTLDELKSEFFNIPERFPTDSRQVPPNLGADQEAVQPPVIDRGKNKTPAKSSLFSGRTLPPLPGFDGVGDDDFAIPESEHGEPAWWRASK